jgi:hypothetical protein
MCCTSELVQGQPRMLPADRRHACCLSGAEIENVANRGISTLSTETFTSTSAVLDRAALLTTFPILFESQVHNTKSKSLPPIEVFKLDIYCYVSPPHCTCIESNQRDPTGYLSHHDYQRFQDHGGITN